MPADIQRIELHGHEVAYRSEGSGPVLVLVHGITSSSATWERVMPALAEHHIDIVTDFVDSTEPSEFDPDELSQMLRHGETREQTPPDDARPRKNLEHELGEK